MIGAIFGKCRDAAFREGKIIPTISKGRTSLTLINVLTVTPEKQHELIALLTEVMAQNAAIIMALSRQACIAASMAGK
jgi:hypothetical protein